ncbi:ribosomal protein S18-alanine N-acetyltransferase [Rheinheimera fenheensis]|uniref:ribosomal protein S18-alanine N-acetyltransferase n=1 Tax=Rheinheimera fenheensis TaxID=3152295 RepID=UPI0032615A78
MKIEFASAADVGQMLQIEREANKYPWTEQAFNSSFTCSYFSYKLLDKAGEMQGFYIAQLILEQLELFNICVASNAQGKGYGKALLLHFLTEGQSRGAAEALLEVRSNNHAAIALYQKAGFSINGQRKGYYVSADGKDDAILMHKWL